jgi:hypothetical protein
LEPWSNEATLGASVSVVVVAEELTEYVMLTVNVSANGVLTAQVARQLLTTFAGMRNFGSAFESTATVEAGIALPLVPKVCNGAAAYDAVPFVTVRFADLT